MVIFLKGHKPDNFDSHNSLKVSFTNIRGLLSSFVEYESFLESNSPDVLGLFETNLDSTDYGNFTILGLTLYLLYINDLPDDVICNIAIYADDTTLYSKCDQASDMCQQLELASELESDLRDTADWGKNWIIDVNAGKTQLVLFDWPNNTGAINVKMDGSVLEENHLLRCNG